MPCVDASAASGVLAGPTFGLGEKLSNTLFVRSSAYGRQIAAAFDSSAPDAPRCGSGGLRRVGGAVVQGHNITFDAVSSGASDAMFCLHTFHPELTTSFRPFTPHFDFRQPAPVAATECLSLLETQCRKPRKHVIQESVAAGWVGDWEGIRCSSDCSTARTWIRAANRTNRTPDSDSLVSKIPGEPAYSNL
ncbi:hypothetical protein BDZ89DRAFT_1170486 [Hymenopellis radicata]|nr:hypothetical protein BDZ89DRAFT_1170486 [Hymenopellis radicata]